MARNANKSRDWSGQRVLASLKECANVSSSAISDLGYNGAAEVLTVTFQSGRTYEYFGVSRQRYQAFCGAGSKGGYLNRVIKPGYAYREV